MPRYDFNCKDCDNVQEEYMTLSEHGKKEIICNKCHSKNTIQVISAPVGFSFHGEGFYETEHGKQQYNK